MHILFLTQVLPYPLDAGPKIRAYYTLRYLSRRHKITLLSFVRPEDSASAIDHFRSFCIDVHTVPIFRSRYRDAYHLLRSLCGRTPFLIARDSVAEMDQRAATLAGSGRFDSIHADQLWMAPYALSASRHAPPGRRFKLVLDQHNAVFQIPQRMTEYETSSLKRLFLRLESRKLARFEVETCARFSEVAWVTGEDQQALRRISGSSVDFPPCTVIPICVDPCKRMPVKRIPGARRVTFVGGLHWPPNAEGIVWFARECWPHIVRRVPDATLTIIGRNPLSGLGDLAGPRCDIAGHVSDLDHYLAETGVFVVPLHSGGGMRVKILDAWAARLPVVSTTIGAEGTAYIEGENLLLGDSAERLSRAVIQVLSDPKLADRLADSGRRTIETQYDWRAVYQAWDGIYDS